MYHDKAQAAKAAKAQRKWN